MSITSIKQSCFTMLCLVALLLAPQAIAGQQRLVVFGDSLSDTGNAFVLTGEQATAPYDLIPSAAYAIGGHHFSNGRTWIEHLAADLGTSVRPIARNPRNNNYAVGAARARGAALFDLSGQVSLYINQYAGADPEVLYVLLIGGNDIRDALVSLQTDPSGLTSQLILSQAVSAVANNLVALVNAGARRFLVVNAPDIGRAPAVTQQGPAAVDAARFLSLRFNDGLSAVLDQLARNPALKIKRFDFFAFTNLVASRPAQFGLTNVTQSCITPGVIAGALCANANDYLFWDGIHPTRAGHRLVGEAAAQELAE